MKLVEGQPKTCYFRKGFSYWMRRAGSVFSILLVLTSVSAYIARHWQSRFRAPDVLKNDDFQQPLDFDLTAYLGTIEKTTVAQWLHAKDLSAFPGELELIQLEANSVELVNGQLPNCQRVVKLVNECAALLKVRPPTVFVINGGDAFVRAANADHPSLVINGAMLSKSMDERELRFLIGRELGHIRCGHLKWLSLRRMILQASRFVAPVPDEIALAPLLPLLKWSREAEISADNAGLICCQNLDAAEQAILRQVHGGAAPIVGRANVDLFLAQSRKHHLNQITDAIFYWRQISSPVPFAAERINQLRAYEKSNRYINIW